jgi:tRNA pseudouridine38/39 synthase
MVSGDVNREDGHGNRTISTRFEFFFLFMSIPLKCLFSITRIHSAGLIRLGRQAISARTISISVGLDRQTRYFGAVCTVKTRMETNDTAYEHWTKEALIERIRALEQASHDKTELASTTQPASVKRRKLAGGMEEAMMTEEASTSQQTQKTIHPQRKKKKEPRPFDMSKYARRRIALKISYLGWDYYGFAAQHVGGNGGLSDITGDTSLSNETSDEPAMKPTKSGRNKSATDASQQLPTVEAFLMKALLDCRLIADIRSSRYTRCGRTDRGVSAAGQVIALDVRSALPLGAPGTLDEHNQTIPWPTAEEAANEEARDAEHELHYPALLNRRLPDNIRVLAWSPVASDFDARFHCQWRRYRYYFDGKGLDIAKMREAAALYVGQHDFRNFCQIDPTKPVMNFERHILSCQIVSAPSIDENEDATTMAQTSSNETTLSQDLRTDTRFYVLDLRGTSFLWHQVRCMMAVLFLVGQGLEPVETVAALLDPNRLAGRPAYDMASELPLVLYECAFKEGALQWRYASDEPQMIGFLRLRQHVADDWTRLYTRWLVCDAVRRELDVAPILSLVKRPPDAMMVEGESSAKSWLMWAATEPDRLPRTDPSRPDLFLGGGHWVRGRPYQPLLQRPLCDTYEVKRQKYIARRAASDRS